MIDIVKTYAEFIKYNVWVVIPLIVIVVIAVIVLAAKKEMIGDAIVAVFGICYIYMSILWWICFWESSMLVKVVPCCILVLKLLIDYIRSDTKSVSEATMVIMAISSLIMIASIK